MNDNLEFFSPGEDAEGVSEAALEQMRERMRAAAAQMKKDQAQEQKQKQTEDALYQILLAFIGNLGPEDKIVRLITAALSKNILAEMILGVISLNYKTVQKVIGLEMVDAKSLKPADVDEKQLVHTKFSNQTLPIHIRVNLDSWIKTINNAAFLKPWRNLTSISDLKDSSKAKKEFSNLISYVAQSYMQKENQEFLGENVIKFSKAFSSNLLERLDKHVKSTKEIE